MTRRRQSERNGTIAINTDLTDITGGRIGCGREQRDSLVFVGEFVGSVDAHIARCAECGFVGATHHSRKVDRTVITLHPHLVEESWGKVSKIFVTMQIGMTSIAGEERP